MLLAPLARGLFIIYGFKNVIDERLVVHEISETFTQSRVMLNHQHGRMNTCKGGAHRAKTTLDNQLESVRKASESVNSVLTMNERAC